jgi:hypothetical protein
MTESKKTHILDSTADETASEQGQADGEAVLGHQFETLEELSLTMQNKIHGASYKKRASDLRQIDDAVKEADQSWDAVEGESESHTHTHTHTLTTVLDPHTQGDHQHSKLRQCHYKCPRQT